IQKMQEQFSVMSKDGRYSENAGAVFCYVQGWTVFRKCRSSFLLCLGIKEFTKIKNNKVI
ncbi:MAG: hypothetical protein ABJJ74_01285, partial [Kangiellaceae bacterium]